LNLRDNNVYSHKSEKSPFLKTELNMRQRKHRQILKEIAHKVMLERGLLPDFSRAVQTQLSRITGPATVEGSDVRDLRQLAWASIDNDDSLDLDQLTVAEALADGNVRILVAIADVDALVKKSTPIDGHAENNTTSIYTAAEIFPMLPVRLSTDLTSLNFDEDRLAVVVDMVVKPEGTILESSVYRARVRNKAKLAYNSVAAWLDGSGDIPAAIPPVSGLAENLHLQDKVAQEMKHFRHLRGALSLDTIQAKPIFKDDLVVELKAEERNRAKEIIEDFMIAANGVVARFLESKNFPSIRRVVRIPERWGRIVEIASEHGVNLPEVPDSLALEAFLVKEKRVDPVRFPDLSVSIIKLLGSGEYVADLPDQESPGHFGLAVKDYSHTTAPNRRYSDLITQRLLKAIFAGEPSPYSFDELTNLAEHLTRQEDEATKVERQVGKSAAALLLEPRIGETFDSIVTGASPKGTWVRLLEIPVEGKLIQGFAGVDVGDQLKVQLISVDVERGFLDFSRSRSK
jgi:exoribonuclease-2